MFKTSNIRFVVISSILISGFVFWTSCAQQNPAEMSQVKPVENKPSPVERGKYLVAIMGCGDCHTPHNEKGEPIAGKELTGHPKGAKLPEWNPSYLKKNIIMTASPDMTAFAGPWGISTAYNLTPDKDSGIGTFTEEQFVKLFKEGVLKPPMPLPAFKNMTDEDIKAMYAYLMSLPPINTNAVDSTTPAPEKPAKPGKGKISG